VQKLARLERSNEVQKNCFAHCTDSWNRASHPQATQQQKTLNCSLRTTSYINQLHQQCTYEAYFMYAQSFHLIKMQSQMCSRSPERPTNAAARALEARRSLLCHLLCAIIFTSAYITQPRWRCICTHAIANEKRISCRCCCSSQSYVPSDYLLPLQRAIVIRDAASYSIVCTYEA
jgi:hypothetical protein